MQRHYLQQRKGGDVHHLAGIDHRRVPRRASALSSGLAGDTSGHEPAVVTVGWGYGQDEARLSQVEAEDASDPRGGQLVELIHSTSVMA